MFSLLILKKTNLADLIRIATLALRGEHINDPKVIYTKANRIKVLTDEKVQLNLDGEFGGCFQVNSSICIAILKFVYQLMKFVRKTARQIGYSDEGRIKKKLSFKRNELLFFISASMNMFL